MTAAPCPALPDNVLGRAIAALPVARTIAHYRAFTRLSLASIFKIRRNLGDDAFRLQLYHIANCKSWAPPRLPLRAGLTPLPKKAEQIE